MSDDPRNHVMKQKRIAIVTEAGNGLGKTFANILIEHGYEVVLAANKASFELLAEEGTALNQYRLFEIDLSSEQSFLDLKKEVELRYGRLDLLINNTEIANGFGKKIQEISIDDVKEVYEVNLFAVIRSTQAFNALLHKSPSPIIINIISSLGDIDQMEDESFCYADYFIPSYSMSKASLNMFTHLLKKESLQSKITVYGFDPVALKNCTHNSVAIQNEVKNEFIAMIDQLD